jgi:hypothetical protein
MVNETCYLSDQPQFMYRHITLLATFLFLTFVSSAQSVSENLVIITLDGMRWQEVFGGVDTALVNDKRFTKDSAEIMSGFWATDKAARREKLFPFLWATVASNGQVYGNRNEGNYANVSNPYRFSYPGYNEIFTGYADTAVNSNEKVPNPNINVLEYINHQPVFKGKVAAFATWDVFPFILNAKRSGLLVNADVDTFHFSSPSFQLLNDMQFLSAKPLGVRLDVTTYLAAREYAKMFHPRVLYIAFDETDDYAHEGEYDQYLKSAHAADAMIADLWKTLQAMPQYKGTTTFIITCDHGRGDSIKKEWTSHGKNIAGADEIWMAVMGPGIKAKGEIRTHSQIYQAQFAQTFASLLGLKFTANHPVASAIDLNKQ